MIWPLYKAEYVNLVVVGATASGEPFSFLAGKHSRYFPFRTPEAGWDDALCAVGAARSARAGKSLRELRIDLDPRGPASGSGIVALAAPPIAGGVPAAMRLELAYQRFRPRQLGKRFNFLDLEWVPGLRWTPFELRMAGPSWVEIGGIAHPIASAYGELEHGVLSSIRGSRFAFTYDYLCGVSAPTAADAAEPYAHVSFVSHALRRRGRFGRALDWYLRRFASERLTLRAGSDQPGDVEGAGPGATDATVLIAHTIDLGYAALERQLVEWVDRHGRPVRGLREIFTPASGW